MTVTFETQAVFHPAGVVTTVFVVPGKVTVKIGDGGDAGISTVGFLLLQCSSGVVRHPRDLQVSVATHFCRVLIFASS